MKPAFASACLASAALVVAWPRSGRIRWRRLAAGGAAARSVGVRIRSVMARRLDPGAAVGGGAVLCGAIGLALGGPVAGIVVAVYATLGGRALVRQRQQAAVARRRARALDELGAMAADLRAGLPVASIVDSPGALGDRAGAALALAAATGAPLADLLDRMEADGRAGDRATAVAAAQRAGVRATALLLAGLPAAGIALGYAIGVDPVHVLLRTPLGAGCSLGALALQIAGLAWSARLGRFGAAA